MTQAGFLHTAYDGPRPVRCQWKNPDFLLKNPDFLLKNDDFIIIQHPDYYSPMKKP